MQDPFIPFGFQYYRSPTPFRDQWEQDLGNIAGQGFNCVKYWVQWRSSVSREGTFVFDDIQELMDIAHRNGLKVILNVIFDVAPAWFYRKYTDSKMVTADGSIVEPRAINCRQIGGAPDHAIIMLQPLRRRQAFWRKPYKLSGIIRRSGSGICGMNRS